MIYKTYKVLYDFKEKMNEKNISSYAASTAFFLFVSMIPIFALICTVISFTSLSEEDFVFLIMEMSPGVVGSFFASLIEDIYAQSAGAISIAIVVTIWSAGKGMMALMRGLNVINVRKHKEPSEKFIRDLSCFCCYLKEHALFISKQTIIYI